MAKNKKATFPIWAATLENIANKRPDKDQLNNNLSVRKDQSDSSPGNFAASQRAVILAFLKTGRPLTTLHSRNSLGIIQHSARVMELKARGNDITTHMVEELDVTGKIHRVARDILHHNNKQLRLF